MLSANILGELEDALRDPYFAARLSEDDVNGYLALLVRMFPSIGKIEPGSSNLDLPDPNDEHLFLAALASHADYLVSGDKKGVLALREHRGLATLGLKILSATAFLAELESTS